MDKKWILLGIILVVGVLMIMPQSLNWIKTNLTLVVVIVAVVIIGALVWKQLTQKPQFLPVDSAKKNLVELCKTSKFPLKHLQTIGIGDVPVVDWGQIVGFASGLRFKVEGKDEEWDVFALSKPFPMGLFSEPQIVLIPKSAHTKVAPNEHVYITTTSLVSYGKFLFPNTVFGTSAPLKIIKEFVGYEMFVKTLNDTGEAVTRAMLSDSEHQRQLELEKMIKKYNEMNMPQNPMQKQGG